MNDGHKHRIDCWAITLGDTIEGQLDEEELFTKAEFLKMLKRVLESEQFKDNFDFTLSATTCQCHVPGLAPRA